MYTAADVHGAMGCDQGSFTLVWQRHQLLSGSLPNGRMSRVSLQLEARSRTFHFVCIYILNYKFMSKYIETLFFGINTFHHSVLCELRVRPSFCVNKKITPQLHDINTFLHNALCKLSGRTSYCLIKKSHTTTIA